MGRYRGIPTYGGGRLFKERAQVEIPPPCNNSDPFWHCFWHLCQQECGCWLCASEEMPVFSDILRYFEKQYTSFDIGSMAEGTGNDEPVQIAQLRGLASYNKMTVSCG